MTQRKVLITSGLPYSNGRLHVGHIAGAYLPADIAVRYLRLTGAEVKFVCGSDDHGVGNIMTAEKEGKTPAESSAFYSDKQKADFKKVDIEFDVFGSTSRNKYHTKVSQDLFLELYNKDYFEKQSSRQYYDETRSMFLPDRYVKGTCGYCGKEDQNGDQCEECGRVLDVETLNDAYSVMSGEKAVIKETVHWFLDLSRCEDIVSNWLEKAVARDTTKKYVRSLISTGLVKRAMTRDIDWGIPVPLEDPDAENKVLYVWFDAPIGYISNTMQLCAESGGTAEDYKDWWKSDDTEIYHFIGEDNTVFHCIIWIAMLHAEGTFKLPDGVIVNQYLNIQFPGKEVEKFSKSRGNAVWVEDYVESGRNIDTLRYYLTAIAPEKARSIYNPEDLVQRNNSDLANTIGNFVNRITSFSIKHFGPEVPAVSEEKLTDTDKAFIDKKEEAFKTITKNLEAFHFKAALENIMEFARECNRYVDEKAPWVTRKTDMETTATSLAYALDAIKFLGVVLNPFIPASSAKILNALNIEVENLNWEEALKPLAAGATLEKPEILFEKMEAE